MFGSQILVAPKVMLPETEDKSEEKSIGNWNMMFEDPEFF